MSGSSRSNHETADVEAIERAWLIFTAEVRKRREAESGDDDSESDVPDRRDQVIHTSLLRLQRWGRGFASRRSLVPACCLGRHLTEDRHRDLNLAGFRKATVATEARVQRLHMAFEAQESREALQQQLLARKVKVEHMRQSRLDAHRGLTMAAMVADLAEMQRRSNSFTRQFRNAAALSSAEREDVHSMQCRMDRIRLQHQKRLAALSKQNDWL